MFDKTLMDAAIQDTNNKVYSFYINEKVDPEFIYYEINGRWYIESIIDHDNYSSIIVELSHRINENILNCKSFDILKKYYTDSDVEYARFFEMCNNILSGYTCTKAHHKNNKTLLLNFTQLSLKEI